MAPSRHSFLFKGTVLASRVEGQGSGEEVGEYSSVTYEPTLSPVCTTTDTHSLSGGRAEQNSKGGLKTVKMVATDPFTNLFLFCAVLMKQLFESGQHKENNFF